MASHLQLGKDARSIAFGYDALPLSEQLVLHDLDADQIIGWQRDADAILRLKGRILPDGHALRAFDKLASEIGHVIKNRRKAAEQKAAYQAKLKT
jgi:hypothetical protein